MPKMKQATLFSLKSWKTKPEDLIVYKKKLEKENTHETVILRTLALLNYASKESIVSHEIDKTLKALAESKNTKIAMEAKLLIDHLRLNGPEPQATKDSSQASTIQKNTDTVKTDQKKLKSPSTDISETKIQMPSTNKLLSLSESSHKTLKKDPITAVEPKITWTKPTEKIGLKKVEERKMDPLKHKNSGPLVEEFSNKSAPKTNQRSYNKGEIKFMKDRIETISKFFLETLGMQQVKLYLDH